MTVSDDLPTAAATHDHSGDLEAWDLAGRKTMMERIDDRSDGLYGGLGPSPVLEPHGAKEKIRAAAWNADGDLTTWTARVHKSGDRISIPESQRRALDLEPGDEILWGVAPIGAPDPETETEPDAEEYVDIGADELELDARDLEVANNNVQNGQGTPSELFDSPEAKMRAVNEVMRERSPAEREQPDQTTLDAARETSETQERLRSAIKDEISRSSFEDELSWRQIAGVLEDILADVSEQSRFND